jgi:hypothetical protein
MGFTKEPMQPMCKAARERKQVLLDFAAGVNVLRHLSSSAGQPHLNWLQGNVVVILVEREKIRELNNNHWNVC